MKIDLDDIIEWFQQLWLDFFSEHRILKQATKASTQLEKRATIQLKIADKADYRATAVVEAAKARAEALGTKSEAAKKSATRAARQSTKIRDSFALDD